MKTKKSIIQWFEKIGNETTNKDDMIEFKNLIEPPLSYCANDLLDGLGVITGFEITISSPRWKYPLNLLFCVNEFEKNECYKIMGF